SGIPPSLLRNQVFWQRFSDCLGDWALDTFHKETLVRMARRRVMPGKIVPDIEEGGLSFLFQSDDETGVSGVMFERALVAEYTAMRLGSSVEESQDVSEVFQRLIMEDAVFLLFLKLSLLLGLSDVNSLERTALQQAELNPLSKYLTISLALPLAEKTFNVHFIFNYGLLKDSMSGDAKRVGKQQFKQSHKVLRDTVASSEIEISVVLDKVQLNVGSCSRFEVGQILPLAAAELSDLKLVAQTMSGESEVARGEMGVWKQNRALKLHTPISESFVRDVSHL
ncbi:MAG: FliM/FliN family flagellar motor C-terminal domain-containing protein, partial [Pseudomonadota bacterium]